MSEERVTEALREMLGVRWWTMLLRGVAAIVFGILAFVDPKMVGLTLFILFGAFAIIDGVLGLIASIGQARRGGRWVWLAVEAVASIAVGVLVFAQPAITLLLLLIFIGVKAGLTGLFLLISSVKLDADHGRGFMIAVGVVNLLFGTLLLAAPMVGVTVLIWWIGAWAILVGLLLVLLGFKLKSARDRVQSVVATFRGNG